MMERTYGLGESTATSYHAYGRQTYGHFVIIRMFPKKLCAHYFVMEISIHPEAIETILYIAPENVRTYR